LPGRFFRYAKLRYSHIFIQCWKAFGGSERANYASFLIGLCELLGVTRPNPSTPSGNGAYVFKREVQEVFTDGTHTSRLLDLYRQGSFMLKTKQGVEAEEASKNMDEIDSKLMLNFNAQEEKLELVTQIKAADAEFGNHCLLIYGMNHEGGRGIQRIDKLESQTLVAVRERILSRPRFNLSALDLYYRLKLCHCVVVKSKIGLLRPKCVDRMNVYLNAVDGQLSHPQEVHNIIPLLRKTQDHSLAEYALCSQDRSQRLTNYQLPGAL
jgi:YhcG PDDEXK nuclease domain